MDHGRCLKAPLSLDEKIFKISPSSQQPSTMLAVDELDEPLEDLEITLTCFQNSCELECDRALARFSRLM